MIDKLDVGASMQCPGQVGEMDSQEVHAVQQRQMQSLALGQSSFMQP